MPPGSPTLSGVDAAEATDSAPSAAADVGGGRGGEWLAESPSGLLRLRIENPDGLDLSAARATVRWPPLIASNQGSHLCAMCARMGPAVERSLEAPALASGVVEWDLAPDFGERLSCGSGLDLEVRHPSAATVVRRFTPGTPEESVTLQRGATLCGRVVDRRGNPVAGADVYLYAVGALWPLIAPRVHTRTDTAGAYGLGADVTGRFALLCLAPGFAPGGALTMAELGRSTDVTPVTLETEAVIEGRIASSGQLDLGQGHVEANDCPGPALALPDGSEVAWTEAGPRVLRKAFLWDDTRRFRIAGLHPGPYRLGLGPLLWGGLSLDATQRGESGCLAPSADVVWRLPGLRWVRVDANCAESGFSLQSLGGGSLRVRGPTGVESVHSLIRDMGGGGWLRYADGVTLVAGRAYRIRVEAPGFVSQEQGLTVLGDEAKLRLEFRMEPVRRERVASPELPDGPSSDRVQEGGRVRLLVTGSRGEPVDAACLITGPEGVQTVARERSNEPTFLWWGFDERSPDEIGDLGVLLPPGEVRLQVSAPGYRTAEQRVTVRAGESTRVGLTLLPE